MQSRKWLADDDDNKRHVSEAVKNEENKYGSVRHRKKDGTNIQKSTATSCEQRSVVKENEMVVILQETLRDLVLCN